ncbi:hypothetical protein RSOLAG22IIIB_07838 [Rhizoctonia solani]|uniref:Uncharacterized protein n=1 Tax=Rhizoctonia solani TaxID=456999 RepID=A0A0K6FPW6_9AGAM|nr:hypothetical protein RSOLAG22IIIB_07838 [Rhizoctonia solani]
MIFSRFLFIAVAAVGVVARSGHAGKRGMIKVPAKLDIRDAYSAYAPSGASYGPPSGSSYDPPSGAPSGTPSAYQTAVNKLNSYQEQTTDAMAGPQSEREAKLITITAGVLETVKTYNSDFKSKFSLFDLSNIAKGGQMSEFGRKLYVILRSCKGTRSDAIYNNISQIGDEVDGMGQFMAEKVPPPFDAMILPAFAKYSDRVDMIGMATKPYQAY